jgi:hypothetical protein
MSAVAYLGSNFVLIMVMLKHKYEDQLVHGNRSQSKTSFKLSCYVLAFALVACSLGSSMLLPAFADPTGSVLASSREDTTNKASSFDLGADEFHEVEALRKAKFGNWKPLADKKQINIMIVDSFSVRNWSEFWTEESFSGVPNPLNYRVDGVVSSSIISTAMPNLVTTSSDANPLGLYGVNKKLLTSPDKPDAMYIRYTGTNSILPFATFERGREAAAEGVDVTTLTDYEFHDLKWLIDIARQVNGPVFVEAGDPSDFYINSLVLASFWAPNVVVVANSSSDGTASQAAVFSPHLHVRDQVSPQKLLYENGVPRGVGIEEFGMLVDFSEGISGYKKVSGSLLSDSLATDSDFKRFLRLMDGYGSNVPLPKHFGRLDSVVFSGKQVQKTADYILDTVPDDAYYELAPYEYGPNFIPDNLRRVGKIMEDSELYIDARTLRSLRYRREPNKPDLDGLYQQVNGRLVLNSTSTIPTKTESFAGAFAFRAFIQSYLQEQSASQH